MQLGLDQSRYGRERCMQKITLWEYWILLLLSPLLLLSFLLISVCVREREREKWGAHVPWNSCGGHI